MTVPMLVRDLGVAPYQPIFAAMQTFSAHRDAATPDELWLLQHEPVFTQGQAGKSEHLGEPGQIPVVQSNRGGQITYHGPGQVVVYPLLDMRRARLGIKDLVELLQTATIRTLRDFGVKSAELNPGAPGVYVNHAKIAALGLRVSRGCSYHGLALNIAMDLEPFERINPCGMAGLPVTHLASFAPDVSVEAAGNTLVHHLCSLLDRPEVRIQCQPWHELCTQMNSR